jgi:hypothetical protein
MKKRKIAQANRNPRARAVLALDAPFGELRSLLAAGRRSCIVHCGGAASTALRVARSAAFRPELGVTMGRHAGREQLEAGPATAARMAAIDATGAGFAAADGEADDAQVCGAGGAMTTAASAQNSFSSDLITRACITHVWLLEDYSDAERAAITRVVQIATGSGTALIDEYRAWRSAAPELTDAMVKAGANADRRRARALASLIVEWSRFGRAAA